MTKIRRMAPISRGNTILTLDLKLITIDDGYHLMVDAFLENKKIHLLIDSGASKSILDERALSIALKEQLIDSEFLSTGIGVSSLKSSSLHLDSLRLDDNLILNDLEIAVMDLSSVTKTYSELGLPTVHGIIGSDVLHYYQAKIDYRQLTMQLFY